MHTNLLSLIKFASKPDKEYMNIQFDLFYVKVFSAMTSLVKISFYSFRNAFVLNDIPTSEN